MIVELNPLKWGHRGKDASATKTAAKTSTSSGDETAMASTPFPLPTGFAPPTPAPLPEHKEGLFHNILDHVKLFFGVALKAVQQYTPEAAVLAEVLFPQFKDAIEADKNILLGGARTIQNAVLTVQQKYSDAAAGDETNTQKLEDALAIVTPLLQPTLAALKVPVPSEIADITNKINATVAILKNFSVPVAKPSEQGT